MKSLGILGCGFVGSQVAKHFKALGWHVRGSATRHERLDEVSAICDEAMLVDSNLPLTLEPFLYDLDALIITVAPGSSKRSYVETYESTANAVSKLLPSYSRLEYVIYISSTSVYGNHEGAFVTEESPLRATTPNQQVLIEAENRLRSVKQDKHLCILRVGEIYGGAKNLDEKVRALQGSVIRGTGEHNINITHIDDISSACDFAIHYKLNGTYNLSSQEHMPRREFYEAICERLGLPRAQIIYDGDQEYQRTQKANKRVDSSKIQKLGYRFLHPTFFEAGV